MTWIILLVCIFLILTDNKKIIPIYIIASMWINFDVRCGPVSFMSALSVFIILLGLIKRRKNLVFKTNIDNLIKKYFIYAIFIYVPFIILSTDLKILTQFNYIKSQIIAILFLIIIWKWKAYNISTLKRHGLCINISIIILCLYGIYTYLTKTNPYMDIIGQYCTNENLSELLSLSIEDARGSLHGRITGTSLYTIQYGILLVIVYFFHISISSLDRIGGNSKYKLQVAMAIVSILIFLNIYLTGSRGPLGAFIIGYAFYLMRAFNWKKKISYISILAIFILFAWPYLESYLLLFTDKDIGGSSVEMRTVQFTGACSMVIGNLQSLLFGKGLGYTAYYLEHYGKHPLALNFESTHVAGIVNYGIMGLLFIFLCNLLILFFIAKRAYNKELIGNKCFYLLASFLLTYFLYNLLVGDVYGGLFLFVYFTILKIGIIQNKQYI